MVNISNESLVARIGELARRGRHVMVELLSYLAEMELRGLHLALGYTSLFSYCTEALRFSKASAFRCTHAASVMAAFPRVAQMLEEGRLGLTSVCLLREVVSEEILDRAAGQTVEQVRMLVASLKPQPAQPDLVRPLSGSTVELRFSVGHAFLADLEQVRALLGHKVPGAGLEAVFHECMRVTLKAVSRRKCGGDKGTVREVKPAKGRYIPAAVRREVWDRDGGRCTFVGAEGRRCGSVHQAEFHHMERHADGGEATVENLTIHCRRHNQYVEERS